MEERQILGVNPFLRLLERYRPFPRRQPKIR